MDHNIETSAPRPDAPARPASDAPLAADLLIGCKAIAEFLGLDERKTYYWHKKRQLRTFKRGALICARKSQLRDDLAAQEVE